MLIIKMYNKDFQLYYSTDNLSLESIALEDVIYYLDNESKENEGFIGFFDWLRKDAESIVGIRLCFFEDLPYIHFLKKLPYVKPTFKNRCMEILFTDDNYNPDLGSDQDFTNNYVYKSKDNEYLFTFGVDFLTENELRNLLKNNGVLYLPL